MNTTAEIYLWGTRIGIIHQEVGKPFASFEYDTKFLISKRGVKSTAFRRYGFSHLS